MLSTIRGDLICKGVSWLCHTWEKSENKKRSFLDLMCKYLKDTVNRILIEKQLNKNMEWAMELMSLYSGHKSS